MRLGGVRASYANAVSGTAAMATGRLAWDAPRFVAALDGSYARFASGWWATQVGGTFYGIHLLGSSAGIGLRADGTAGLLSDRAWSGTVSVGPVASLLAGPSVLSASLAIGGLRRIDSMASATVSGGLRARMDAGPWSFQWSLDGTHARGISFADATAEMSYDLGPLELGAVAGGRTGDLGGKPWLQGHAQLRAARWATVEVQAGKYPKDISGFTSGSFVSVGVWLRPWHRPSSARGGRAGAAQGVTIEPVAPGRERITFVVPGAERVAIAGEWNDWTPVALVRLDGQRWRGEVALGKGAHRFSLLVDGGRWYVPAGVPSLPDSFGGTVGLLVVD